MNSITISIRTANAAFSNDDGSPSEDTARSEVARILRDAAKHIEAGSDGRTLHDSNGNKVGVLSID